MNRFYGGSHYGYRTPRASRKDYQERNRRDISYILDNPQILFNPARMKNLDPIKQRHGSEYGFYYRYSYMDFRSLYERPQATPDDWIERLLESYRVLNQIFGR